MNSLSHLKQSRNVSPVRDGVKLNSNSCKEIEKDFINKKGYGKKISDVQHIVTGQKKIRLTFLPLVH